MISYAFKFLVPGLAFLAISLSDAIAGNFPDNFKMKLSATHVTQIENFHRDSTRPDQGYYYFPVLDSADELLIRFGRVTYLEPSKVDLAQVQNVIGEVFIVVRSIKNSRLPAELVYYFNGEGNQDRELDLFDIQDNDWNQITDPVRTDFSQIIRLLRDFQKTSPASPEIYPVTRFLSNLIKNGIIIGNKGLTKTAISTELRLDDRCENRDFLIKLLSGVMTKRKQSGYTPSPNLPLLPSVQSSVMGELSSALRRDSTLGGAIRVVDGQLMDYLVTCGNKSLKRKKKEELDEQEKGLRREKRKERRERKKRLKLEAKKKQENEALPEALKSEEDTQKESCRSPTRTNLRPTVLSATMRALMENPSKMNALMEDPSKLDLLMNNPSSIDDLIKSMSALPYPEADSPASLDLNSPVSDGSFGTSTTYPQLSDYKWLGVDESDFIPSYPTGLTLAQPEFQDFPLTQSTAYGEAGGQDQAYPLIKLEDPAEIDEFEWNRLVEEFLLMPEEKSVRKDG